MATDDPVKIIEGILAGSPASHSAEDEAAINAQVDDVEGDVKKVRGVAVTYLLRDGTPEPDWRLATRLLTELLSRTVYSSRALALLLESLTHQFGWPGLAAGARLYRVLIDDRTSAVYPLQPAQRHALFFLQTKDFNQRPPLPMPLPVWNVPVLFAGGRGVGLYDVQLLEKQHRKFPSLTEVEAARAALIPAERKGWVDAASEALNEVGLLRASLLRDFERSGGEPPAELDASFQRLETRIHKYTDHAQHWLGGTEAPTPPAGDVRPQPPVPLASAGIVRDRGDALRYLKAIENYFERADPHSPVRYRLRTAQRWLNQSVTQVLAELIPAGDHLATVTKELGLDPDEKGNGPTETSAEAVSGVVAETALQSQVSEGHILSEGQAQGRPLGVTQPLVVPDRHRALQWIEAVRKYLSDAEPHSMARFPLAFAAKIVKLPLQEIIEQAISDETAREKLLKELGVPFVSKSAGERK